MDYTLCPVIIHSEIQRDTSVIYTTLDKKREEDENRQYLESKFNANKRQKPTVIEVREVNKTAILLIHNTNRAIQSETLKIYRRQCCDGQCDICGVDMGSSCEIDNDDNKYVTYYKYINADKIKKDGTIQRSNNKVLAKVTATYKVLFSEAHQFLKEKYLPHF